MQTLNQGEWPTTWTKKLEGFRRIFEMRFEVMNVQYRPLFFFGVEQQVIFVFPALEIGDDFKPPDAPERADARRQSIIAGRTKTYEIDIFSLV